MTWRRVPPVFSPVSARAIIDGVGAILGVSDDATADVEGILRRRYGAEDVILTDSGTSALQVVLRTLLPKDATLALPAYCCIDVTAAAVAAGVRVRLYDLDPVTLSPNPDSIRAVLKRGVDAIVVAHLYGYPADMRAVQTLAAAEGVPVIEDAAQGAGGSADGKPLGGLGEISILSFGRGKGVTAGAGGAVLLNRPGLASRVRDSIDRGPRGVSALAGVVAQSILARPGFYRLPSSIPALRLGEMVYRPANAPRAISPASAALLRRTSVTADRDAEARRVRVRPLVSAMESLRGVIAVRPIRGGTPGYLRLAMLDAAGTREPRPDLGVMRGYPMTLDEHPQLHQLLQARERAGSGSTYLRDKLFTLPTHSRTRDSDFAAVMSWLRATDASPQTIAVFS